MKGTLTINIGENTIKPVTDIIRDGTKGTLDLIATVTHSFAPGLQAWAARNQMRVVDKIDAENRERVLAGQRPIPLRLAAPAFHKIAEEDDEEKLGDWARMLSNLQDGECDDEPDRRLVYVLAAIEAVDSTILKAIANRERDDPERPFIRISVDDLVTKCGHDREAVILSLHHLASQGCLWTSPIPDDTDYARPRLEAPRFGPSNPTIEFKKKPPDPGPPAVWSETIVFRLTSLGVKLVDVCRPAGEKRTGSIYWQR